MNSGAMMGIGFAILLGSVFAHLVYYFCYKKIPFQSTVKPRQSAYLPIIGKKRAAKINPDEQSTTFQAATRLFTHSDSSLNTAFVYIKPHSISRAAISLVYNYFGSHNLSIVKHGKIHLQNGEGQAFFDRIYSEERYLAQETKPGSIEMDEKMKTSFLFHFGEEWDECIANNSIFNASDVCSNFNLSYSDLLEAWLVSCSRGKHGFITEFMECCQIEITTAKRAIYCINGYYMGARDEFATQSILLPYFVLEWKSTDLSWDRFHEDIIGCYHPEKAKSSSLRGMLYQHLEELGLHSHPNSVMNLIHASKSSFNALVEQLEYVQGTQISDCSFGQFLLQQKFSPEVILELARNPSNRSVSLFRKLYHAENVDAIKILRIYSENVLLEKSF